MARVGENLWVCQREEEKGRREEFEGWKRWRRGGGRGRGYLDNGLDHQRLVKVHKQLGPFFENWHQLRQIHFGDIPF